MNYLACNICQNSISLLDGYFHCPDTDKGEWQFACVECEGGGYDVQAKRFFHSPGATIDWLAHLREKLWFSPEKFLNFIDELRDKGAFYGQG